MWPYRKRIAIVLSGVGWDAAPFDDLDVEIWTCNDTHRLGLPKITCYFEMHRPEDWYLSDRPILSCEVPRGKYLRPTSHADTLNALNVPIYMQEKSDQYPTSIRYPLEQATQAAGHRALFDSSLGYMLGLALLKRPKWVGIYGANMSGPEYSKQRPNAQWLLGIAVGRGIRVAIGQPSSLLTASHLYAYHPEPATVPDDVRRRLVSVLNVREQLVQTWIDGAESTPEQREQVRTYDQQIAQCYQAIAKLGLDMAGVDTTDLALETR